MAYLLAKFSVLFLLTALLGIFLGYWWSRRSFVDVTESFEALARSNRPDTSSWDRLWQRLDALAKPRDPDLSGVYERLEGVSGAISGLPRPQPVSLASVDSRLDSLADKIEKIPAPIIPESPDLQPVNMRLAEIESAIKAIPTPEKPQVLDLGPISARLGKIEESIARIPQPKPAEPVRLEPLTARISELERTIRAIPQPKPVEPVRLEPVINRIEQLEIAIRNLPKPEFAEPVRLEPLTARIEKLESAVRSIPRPEPVNLRPVDQRLDAIETEIRNLRGRVSQPTRAVAPEPSAPKASGPRLLKGASYGQKDDLKRISGVGPKLEALLNQNGVYYFWQVASWTGSDISLMDARLDVFKGRIDRDNWVSQAKKLQREEGAAKAPAE